MYPIETIDREKVIESHIKDRFWNYVKEITRSEVSQWADFCKLQPMIDDQAWRYRGCLIFTEGGWFNVLLGTKCERDGSIESIFDKIDDYLRQLIFENVMRKTEAVK